MAYDDFEGCRAMFPASDKSCFDPNNDKIMETAKNSEFLLRTLLH